MEDYTITVLNAIKVDVISLPYRGRGAQILKNEILDVIDKYVSELSKDSSIHTG
jgi:hypothetical protein